MSDIHVYKHGIRLTPEPVSSETANAIATAFKIDQPDVPIAFTRADGSLLPITAWDPEELS